LIILLSVSASVRALDPSRSTSERETRAGSCVFIAYDLHDPFYHPRSSLRRAAAYTKRHNVRRNYHVKNARECIMRSCAKLHVCPSALSCAPSLSLPLSLSLSLSLSLARSLARSVFASACLLLRAAKVSIFFPRFARYGVLVYCAQFVLKQRHGSTRALSPDVRKSFIRCNGNAARGITKQNTHSSDRVPRTRPDCRSGGRFAFVYMKNGHETRPL